MAHDSHAHDGAHGHTIVPIKVYVVTGIALAVLMLLTVAAAYIDLGSMNAVVAMVIAIIKAGLIVLFFMNVKYSTRLTWIFVASAFFWLFILLGMFLPDYLARDFVHQSDAWTSSPTVPSVLPIDKRVLHGELHGHEDPAPEH
ncbi:MAG: cytochrome C oxidase subunit IV family protein [Candidatus Hydrogenedentes bacterium]|nr:cytochrome C oxidase subunit IV family protein [Candidatus Hydrogenedentota bacterium]